MAPDKSLWARMAEEMEADEFDLVKKSANVVIASVIAVWTSAIVQSNMSLFPSLVWTIGVLSLGITFFGITHLTIALGRAVKAE